MTEAELLASRILVIDDEEPNVELLERLLAQEGFGNVVGTTESARVFELYGAFQPDLVLLDLRMPDVDGYEVLGKLTARERVDHVPVIVLTADVTREARHRALGLGAHDFIIKPFDAIEVVLRVCNHLHTRWLYKQLRAHDAHAPLARVRGFAGAAGTAGAGRRAPGATASSACP